MSIKKKLYMETIQDIKSKAKFLLYRYAGERIQITHVGDIAKAAGAFKTAYDLLASK